MNQKKRGTTSAYRKISGAAVLATLVWACGSSQDEFVEEGALGEVQESVLQTCDWKNAPTDGTLALGPGAGTSGITVAAPYGSPSCPNQTNIALTNIQNRTLRVETANNPLPTTQSECWDWRMDLQLARRHVVCLPGRNCWSAPGTVKYAGVWIATPPDADSGAGGVGGAGGGLGRCVALKTGDSAWLSLTETNHFHARINARIYRASTNVNFSTPVNVAVHVQDGA